MSDCALAVGSQRKVRRPICITLRRDTSHSAFWSDFRSCEGGYWVWKQKTVARAHASACSSMFCTEKHVFHSLGWLILLFGMLCESWHGFWQGGRLTAHLALLCTSALGHATHDLLWPYCTVEFFTVVFLLQWSSLGTFHPWTLSQVALFREGSLALAQWQA